MARTTILDGIAAEQVRNVTYLHEEVTAEIHAPTARHNFACILSATIDSVPKCMVAPARPSSGK
ncbi:MAG TPA: hypothetical protein VNR65_16640 [Geobacterales bacterium]|nr:hypothetical protein [Geobacterales bacterium]